MMTTANSLPYACTGTTRKGRACGRRVAEPGAMCDRCVGPAPLPVFAAPNLELVKDDTADDDDDPWTPSGAIADRLAPLAAGNALLEELVDVCVRLSRSSRAESSKRAYEQHWSTFAEFCRLAHLDTALPVPATTVMLFVAWLAHYGRLDRISGERDGNGEPLATGYLRQAVAAIGHRHTVAGLASPTDNAELQAMLRGYGRIHGTANEGQDPLRIGGVTTISVMLSAPAAMAARNRALLLLATNADLDLNAGQIGRLKGSHILMPDEAGEPIGLLVHPGGRSLSLDERDVPHDHDVPEACAACALIDLKPPRHGPVFASASGQALARQNVMKLVRTAVAAHGLAPISDDGLPRLDTNERAQLALAAMDLGAAEVRDRALVLLWYWGCFRGEELSNANWGHPKLVTAGYEFCVPFAKTDQLGKGEITGIPYDDNPLLCPVTALEAWRATLQRLVGRELTPMDPMFGRVEVVGGPLLRTSRESLSDIVTRRAQAAGIEGDISGHSLRSGFVVDAIDKRIPREQIQKHGRWKNIASLDKYYKKTNVFGDNNPAQQLGRAIGAEPARDD